MGTLKEIFGIDPEPRITSAPEPAPPSVPQPLEDGDTDAAFKRAIALGRV